MHGIGECYNAVYACRRVSMAAGPAVDNWRDVVAGTRLMRGLCAERARRGIIMHDLPAHRGAGIETALPNGPMSRVVSQACNEAYAVAAGFGVALDRL